MAEHPSRWVITGSRTDDGCVVYLCADGSWATTLEEAHPFGTKDEAEGRLAEVRPQESIVTEPYVFDVDTSNDQLQPRSAREQIRVAGPSTRLRRPDHASTVNR